MSNDSADPRLFPEDATLPRASYSEPELSPDPPLTPEYVAVSEDLSGLKRLGRAIDAEGRISEKRLELLHKLDLKTIDDLLENYPRDYLDRRRMTPIANAGNSTDIETIEGRVVRHEDVATRNAKGPKVSKVILFDGTGLAALVGFGKRAGYLKISMREGDTVVVSGKFKRTGRGQVPIETTMFEYEVLSDEDAELIHTGRLVSVYRLTADLPQRYLRTLIARAVQKHADDAPEALPVDIRRRYKLIHHAEALRQIHLPESNEGLRQARRRLVFEEFFYLQIGLLLRKNRVETEEPGIAFDTDDKLARSLIDSLPFTLTNAQIRATREIERDMRSTRPMNRLVQGDVGSGKTIVAAIALTHAVANGYQGAMMAPTEILAEQHYHTLRTLLVPAGLDIALLKGDMSASEKRAALERVADGTANIVVGTHALIQKSVEFANLGFVITDEQHRFGVLQRDQLRTKGITPDTLVMTATPIPRTLALTAYGDLSLSLIDELPPGRMPIQTKRFNEGDRDHLYKFIESQLRHGRQAYVIYPLVEESEKLEDIQAAVEGHVELSAVFPQWRVGLLHGRMNADEKSDTMAAFKNHDLDILVSTTVIEVGVDVPNANVIVIEHADRFGLAQLHQLRGRVGRGEHQSYCALVGYPKSEDGRQRLDVMTRTTSGFEIAEEDLKIRGPGEILGTKQSGIPDLKIANLVRDGAALEVARQEATTLIADDPTLSKSEHAALREIVALKWRGKLRLATVG
ncbi:MAG: ATP-dependent DNA helicase RecG [Candidatus Poribacteria bacterium]|nr:ATP-dependent DNA helicase RecG [Candidatus Poribacteria bacterium]